MPRVGVHYHFASPEIPGTEHIWPIPEEWNFSGRGSVEPPRSALHPSAAAGEEERTPR